MPNLIIIESSGSRCDSHIAWLARRWSISTRWISPDHLGSIGWEGELQLVDGCADGAVGKRPPFGFDTWTRSGNIAKREFGVFPFSHDGQTVGQIVVIEGL